MSCVPRTEVESAIDTNSVMEYANKCTAQLDDLIDLVRGKLTKLQRSSIGAMVVLDVHARDMTVNLASQEISQTCQSCSSCQKE